MKQFRTFAPPAASTPPSIVTMTSQKGGKPARGHQHGAERRREQKGHDPRFGQGDVIGHDVTRPKQR